MIIAAMATMPQRLHLLEKAISSIRPQVDVVRVYLNSFDEVPSFLKPEEGFLAKNFLGDIGDAGKFFWFDKGGFDYYLTADDDILYPPDYVMRLVEEFEARHQKAIVGVHGFVFSEPIESYVTSRAEKYKCTYGLASARSVHIIGTATAILNRTTIKLSLKDFPRHNMADLQLAIIAQKQQVPMVVISRDENWIQELQDAAPKHGFSIWKEAKKDGGRMLADVANKAVRHWQLFPDPK